jgi:hypothetical protein
MKCRASPRPDPVHLEWHRESPATAQPDRYAFIAHWTHRVHGRTHRTQFPMPARHPVSAAGIAAILDTALPPTPQHELRCHAMRPRSFLPREKQRLAAASLRTKMAGHSPRDENVSRVHSVVAGATAGVLTHHNTSSPDSPVAQPDQRYRRCSPGPTAAAAVGRDENGANCRTGVTPEGAWLYRNLSAKIGILRWRIRSVLKHYRRDDTASGWSQRVQLGPVTCGPRHHITAANRRRRRHNCSPRSSSMSM